MKRMIVFRTSASNPKAIHFIRFVLVGVLNTTFSYLIYAGLLFVGFGYQLANLLALLVGILFSFKTQGHLVFNNPDNRLLGRFIVSWALIYLCTITLIGRIMTLGFDAYSAGALSLPLSVALSYFGQRYFVFNRSTTKKQGADGV
jgi:putative flippase GtrA